MYSTYSCSITAAQPYPPAAPLIVLDLVPLLAICGVSHFSVLGIVMYATDNGHIWGLPLYRLAGVYSPANGEFSTAPFPFPAATAPALWVNAEATWGQWGLDGSGPWSARPDSGGQRQQHDDGNYVGGADEGRAAYLMVALQKQQQSSSSEWVTVPGYEPQRCLFTNMTGLKLPLVWGNFTQAPEPVQPPPPPREHVAVGSIVRLRFFFRDATVFAAGAFGEAGSFL